MSLKNGSATDECLFILTNKRCLNYKASSGASPEVAATVFESTASPRLSDSPSAETLPEITETLRPIATVSVSGSGLESKRGDAGSLDHDATKNTSLESGKPPSALPGSSSPLPVDHRNPNPGPKSGTLLLPKVDPFHNANGSNNTNRTNRTNVTGSVSERSDSIAGADGNSTSAAILAIIVLLVLCALVVAVLLFVWMRKTQDKVSSHYAHCPF